MAGRPKTYQGYDEERLHRVTIVWPKSVWKELQRLAIDEDTSATALVIKAVEQFLEAKRKEGAKKHEH